MNYRAFSITILTLATSACIGANAQTLSKTHVSFMACVDVQATRFYYEDIPVDDALQAGVEKCRKELDAYVDELVAQVKSAHELHSVQPRVYKEVRKDVIESTIAAIKPSYLAHEKTTAPQPPEIARDADIHLQEARELQSDCIVLKSLQEIQSSEERSYNRQSVMEKCSIASQKYHEAMYAKTFKITKDRYESMQTANDAVNQLNDTAFSYVENAQKGDQGDDDAPFSETDKSNIDAWPICVFQDFFERNGGKSVVPNDAINASFDHCGDVEHVFFETVYKRAFLGQPDVDDDRRKATAALAVKQGRERIRLEIIRVIEASLESPSNQTEGRVTQ